MSYVRSQCCSVLLMSPPLPFPFSEIDSSVGEGGCGAEIGLTCVVYTGYLEVNKVAGNFHFAPGTFSVVSTLCGVASP